MLPSKSWTVYEEALCLIGERRGDAIDRADLAFLRELDFICRDNTLSPSGARYFAARFIKKDPPLARRILQEALRQYGPAAALLQLLFGVASATRGTAATVLRAHGFGEDLDDRRLGSLLMLLARAELVRYNKRDGSLIVTDEPLDSEVVSENVFISPTTPYGNRAWLKRILRACEKHVWWLDKHFMPAAFEELWEVCDGNRVSDVRILSLRLNDHSGKRVSRDYRDLKRELAARSVKFDWRTVDSTVIRDTHDRWIIGGAQAWNVPNVGAIYSGQHSEMHKSSNVVELQKLYKTYWENGQPFSVEKESESVRTE